MLRIEVKKVFHIVVSAKFSFKELRHEIREHVIHSFTLEKSNVALFWTLGIGRKNIRKFQFYLHWADGTCDFLLSRSSGIIFCRKDPNFVSLLLLSTLWTWPTHVSSTFFTQDLWIFISQSVKKMIFFEQ